jgi:hypothetical protein
MAWFIQLMPQHQQRTYATFANDPGAAGLSFILNLGPWISVYDKRFPSPSVSNRLLLF